jgi:hypothetical protein
MPWKHIGRIEVITYFLIRIMGGGLQPSPLGTSTTNWPTVPAPGGMIGRGNRSTRRKPALVQRCSPQIPNDLIGHEAGPPRWEASNYLLEIWHGFKSWGNAPCILKYDARKKWGLSSLTQAVSRRLPTAEAQVRSHFSSCGICDGHSGTMASFLRVLRFPLPFRIPPVAPHSLIVFIIDVI